MSLNKKIRKHLQNRPTYEIDPSYGNNVAIARMTAFGRNPAVMNAEDSIRNSTANSVNQVAQQSGSANNILATINAMNQGQNRAFQDLASQESQIQQQNMGTYFATTNQLAEERDKAWNYNVNEPWQVRLASLRDRKAARQRLVGDIMNTVGSIGTSVLTGGLGPIASGGGGGLK